MITTRVLFAIIENTIKIIIKENTRRQMFKVKAPFNLKKPKKKQQKKINADINCSLICRIYVIN